MFPVNKYTDKYNKWKYCGRTTFVEAKSVWWYSRWTRPVLENVVRNTRPHPSSGFAGLFTYLLFHLFIIHYFFFFWPLAHVLELDLIWLICLFWAGEFMHQGNAVLFCVIFLYWALGSPVLRNLRLWCASLWFQAVVLNQRRDLRGYLTPRVPWEQYSGIWLV